MFDAGLVEVRRDAQRRLYRLRPEPLMELDAWLEPYRTEWARRLGSLERHLRRTTEPIPRVRRCTDETLPRASYDGVLERTADGGVIRFERSASHRR